MKKVLSVLGLIAIISMTNPVLAAPGGGHGGSGGGFHGPQHGHRVHAGAHHRPHHVHHMGHHRPHAGITFHAGHPRHSYWYGYRGGYWGNSWCDYRLGWGYPNCGVYVPMSGAAFSIRF